MASDTALPAIIRFDTTANRLLFTPTPGVPEQLYIWLDSDNQPDAYYWDGAAWQSFNSGLGDVNGPGISINNDIAVFDGVTGKLIKDGGSTIAQVITDAVTAAIAAIIPIDLTTDVTGNLPFANLEPASTDSILLGRGDSGAGDFEEITLGGNLTMTGTVLNAIGAGSGDVVGPASAVDDNIATFDGITGKLIQDGGQTIAQVIAAAGDVDGPGSAVNNNIAVFDGVTGKLIKDGGSTIASIAGINQLTGEVTAGPGSGSVATVITPAAVTYAKIQNTTVDSILLGRAQGAGAGQVGEITLGTGLAMVGAVLSASGGSSITALTGDVTATGPGSVAGTVKTALKTETRGATADGGTSVLVAGIVGYISFPVACTIKSWRMLADAAGACAMELKKANYATFPTMTSITAAAPPAIAATNQKAESSSLGTWTTSVAAGDVIEVSITGTPATIKRVNLFIEVELS